MTEKHICEKESIKWEVKPQCESGYDILWFGKCSVCKRAVYETYSQNEELFDAETDREIE